MGRKKTKVLRRAAIHLGKQEMPAGPCSHPESERDSIRSCLPMLDLGPQERKERAAWRFTLRGLIHKTGQTTNKSLFLESRGNKKSFCST